MLERGCIPLILAVASTSTVFRHAFDLSQSVDTLRPLSTGHPGTIYAYSPKPPKKGARASECYCTTTKNERRTTRRWWKRTVFVLTITHHTLQRFPGPSQRPILIEILRNLGKRGPSIFLSFWEASDEQGPRGWWLWGFGALC